jgi:hypothetical protein
MNALSSSSEPANDRRGGGRQCVFCLEDIRAGASTCPHCGSNLAPLQQFADKHAELQERIIALEQEVGALRANWVEKVAIGDASDQAPTDPVAPLLRAEIKWPHMADNIILGLATLLAAHWLATTRVRQDETSCDCRRAMAISGCRSMTTGITCSDNSEPALSRHADPIGAGVGAPRMLVRFFAVMLRCGGMLLSFLVPTLPMMMGRLSVVTCGGRLRAAT